VNTILTNKRITGQISKSLTDSQIGMIAVRSASPNSRTGRCLFDFDNAGPAQVVVAAVLDGEARVEQFYVIPRSICPTKLLLRPGSKVSKWFSYYCEGDPTALISSTLEFCHTTEHDKLLKRLRS
jgi:hypothetical protein